MGIRVAPELQKRAIASLRGLYAFDGNHKVLGLRYAHHSTAALWKNTLINSKTMFSSMHKWFPTPLCLESEKMQSFINYHLISRRFFAGEGSILVVDVPHMGDSISEGVISEWKKEIGDYIKEGEVIGIIETDKIAVDIIAPESGMLTLLHAEIGGNVMVGAALYEIDTAAKPEDVTVMAAAAPPPPAATPPPPAATPPPPAATPPPPAATPPPPAATPPPPAATPVTAQKATPAPTLKPSPVQSSKDLRGERRTPMSRMRIRIAERLKGAQNTAASLTTFNECDMGNLMALRNEMNDSFQEAHKVKMGFVSAFLLASTLSLKKHASVNAYIEENEIVYKDYVDISVAVATPSGLLVPVVRDCDKKTWAALEQDLADLAARARTNQIALEEMAGGTFTISNGGVYGSMMGTPLLNLPQSSILGMHSIVKRPVVRGDQIVIRPMMYLALTYDHRLIDGREAVTFLNSIKNYIEDPRKMLLQL